MRKCMFLPVPPDLAAMLPPVSPAAMPPRPPPPARAEAPVVPHRHVPQRDVQMFPAYGGGDALVSQKRADLYAAEKAKLLGRRASPSSPWFEDPIVIGTLLLLMPPVGLAAVWSSKRYSDDARWALTVMTGLMMCLAAAVMLVILVRL